MKLVRVSMILFGLLCGSRAVAQDPVQQQQQQQFQAEQNRLGYYNSQGGEIPLPPRPAGKWIKTWGAIAKDIGGTDAGVAEGKLSRKEAEQAAVKQCIDGGGRNCGNVFAYHNQCVAYAAGQMADGRWSEDPASAESIERASRLALQSCTEYGGKDCKILYTACTDPIFQRY